MIRQTLKKISTALLASAVLAISTPSLAADEYLLIIKDHKFEPAQIKVPAGKKVKLVVHNQDPTPEEFHSDDLRREKVMLGGKKVSFFIGPLKPGNYNFMGEFNEATAKGVVIVE